MVNFRHQIGWMFKIIYTEAQTSNWHQISCQLAEQNWANARTFSFLHKRNAILCRTLQLAWTRE